MAVDMFLHIDGVNGEATDSKNKDKIDITSWSWGATNQGGAHHGGGMGAGKVNVHDVSITKLLDLSTASLLQSVSTGKHFKNAKIVVRKAGEEQLDYYILTMDHVFVTSYSISGSSMGSDLLNEQLTLTFKKYKVEYVRQDEKGKKSGGNDFTYDLMAQKAA